MKKLIALFFIALGIFIARGYGQELYVYSEPASNMATNAVGIRLNNYALLQRTPKATAYMLAPEVMFGVSKKLMVHAEGYFSNMQAKFEANGASVYGKYRLYSQDEIHNHFRIAMYGMLSRNNLPVTQKAIDLYGRNSGYLIGVVATKLINRVAYSAGTSVVHASDNARGNKFNNDGERNAINYNLSVGGLLLPEEYIDYKQTNVNLMAELLGQTNLQKGTSFLDLAPSVQFIFKSRMRLDLGYRFTLKEQLNREYGTSFLVRFEYNLFNVF